MPCLFCLILSFVLDRFRRNFLDVVRIDVGAVRAQYIARRGGGLPGARAIGIAVEVRVAEVRARGIAREALLEVTARLALDAEAVDLPGEAGGADDVARAVGAVARAERA